MTAADILTHDDSAHTEELVRHLTHLLRCPGSPTHARADLDRADTTFSRLDRMLRRGRSLPSSWRIDPYASDAEHSRITDLYDQVSEELRTLGDTNLSWRALTRAGDRWGRLDTALRFGAPLPEPWWPSS
ncbi:hypothetical protein [Nocardiopsis listeri]|uniref:hypothetical protein n=1 Tax=Nocardiopsis listeri TaxID=53440 RepID=UPI00082A786A|nr:hypothetical protein [Nocardiopsis listeri]